MTPDIDCVVVGGGIIGLAVARALAIAGHDVLVLEQEAAIGTGVSSRSSEVIHAGLYYAPGSWRARLCVAGRHMLYQYCEAHGVAARACGKLVVATDLQDEVELDLVEARATANGVEDLRRLDAAETRTLEPALACTGALLSPATGIVDSRALMLSLQGEAADHGAVFAFNARLDRVEAGESGFTLQVGGAEATTLRCRRLVNAAGLGAVALAQRTDGLPAVHVPTSWLSKGSYFTLSGPAPFTRLIYPVPIPGGAGIHLTFDMAGQARFGPDVEAVDRPDYSVDPARAGAFASAIRRYWPGLPHDALRPGYAGLRPKIVPPTETADFAIDGADRHGVAGLVNLFGIESPGLTSCLAIGQTVATMLA